MFALRRIVSRSNPSAIALLRRPIHSTSTLRNAAASESDIHSKLNDGERAIYDKLKAEFGSKTLDVVDVSGMFWSALGVSPFLTLRPMIPALRRMRIFLRHPYLLPAIQGPVNNQAAQARQPVSEGRGESDPRVAGMRSRASGDVCLG
jgi:hypothetical protein